MDRRTLFEPNMALLAVTARICNPLDPDSLAYFDRRCLRMLRDGNDLPHAFVSSNQRQRRLKRPIAFANVEVGVTHSCADHLDETLAGGELGRLGDWDIMLEHNRLLAAGDNGSKLGLWKLIERHEVGSRGGVGA